MGWKRKEKQLTPEEAVELARAELAPLWLGSGVQLAAVRGPDGRASVHPIDKEFEKRAWLLLFAELTEYDGEGLLLCAREWYKRYAAHELGILLVVRSAYSFLGKASGLAPILRKNFESFPIVVDSEGLISEAFGIPKQGPPAALLLHKRKVLFARGGKQWLDGLEREVQSFLRLLDPGLPLSPPYMLSSTAPQDVSSAELGQRNRSKLIQIEGAHTQEAERVVIRDPATVVRFVSPAARVGLVAQSGVSGEMVTRARFEINRDNVFDSAASADLILGDDGSEVRIGDARLYQALQALPEKKREIAIRFPDADRLPVFLYAIRFGL